MSKPVHVSSSRVKDIENIQRSIAHLTPSTGIVISVKDWGSKRELTNAIVEAFGRKTMLDLEPVRKQKLLRSMIEMVEKS